MKKLFYILLLLATGTIIGQTNPYPSLISISIGVPDSEVIIATTSTSATWSPQIVTNTGEILIWEVTGGVEIAEQTINDPTFDLSTNTGEAIIHIRSNSEFVGFTHLSANNLAITSVTGLSLQDMVDFSVKQNPSLASLNLTLMPKAQKYTIRDNNLSTIDLTNNPLLTHLYIYGNQLTYIDILSNPLLSNVSVNNNKLSSAALDEIVNVLDANGVPNGVLNLDINTGALTAASYDSFQSLKAKGWTITPANHPYIPPEPPPVASLLKPVISGFTIENLTPTQVNFTASSDVSTLTTTGFTISGKTISSITLDGDGLGGYFTVSSAFNFWDNNTIRLESGDGTIYDFTMEYITNNIDEPTAATYRYVSATASGGDGLSEGTAWTMAEAVANASSGMTIWIKAGDYGATTYICNTSGLVDSPIKYIGYKTAIEDITSNYYDFGVTMSTSEMPTFNGSGYTEGNDAFKMRGSYVIWKNIQVTNFSEGFKTSSSSSGPSYYVFDNVNIYDMGSSVSVGTGFSFRAYGGLINMRITNSVVVDASFSGIVIRSDGATSPVSTNLIDNCKVYCTGTLVNTATDYFIQVSGHDNIVRNSLVDYRPATGSIGSLHGITLKGYDMGTVNAYNLFEGNLAIDVQEGLCIRNYGCNNNVVKNNEVRGVRAEQKAGNDSGGIVFFGGVWNNIVENNLITNVTNGIGLTDVQEEEGTQPDVSIGHDNTIRNNIIYNCTYVFALSSQLATADWLDNYMYNNTISTADFFLNSDQDATVTNFAFYNNIVDNVTSSGDGGTTGFVSDYNNFTNSFITSLGTNSSNVDPNFVNTVSFVPQGLLQLAPKSANYDYNYKERENITTIGAVTLASEVAGEAPGILPDYYVSTLGSDSNDGLTVSTPWQTLSKVETEHNAGTFAGGKTIAFKRGDTFTGKMALQVDSGTLGNEIVYTAYGAGAQPIITSIQDYSSIVWTPLGGNIWVEGDVIGDSCPRMKIDGVEVLGTTLYSELGTSIPDLVQFFKGDNGVNGNHLYVYSVTDPNTRTFEFSANSGGTAYNYTVACAGVSYVQFSNIEFKGGYYQSVNVYDSSNLSFTNCTFGDMANTGVYLPYNTLQNTNVIFDSCVFDANFIPNYSGSTIYSTASIRGNYEGIRFTSINGGEVKNCTFDDWGHASISATSESQETITGVLIHDNEFRATHITYGGGYTTDGLNVYGNEIYNNYSYQTKANQINGHDNHVHHNLVVEAKNSTIHSWDTGYGFSLQNYYEGCYNNIIENNNIISAASFGIYVDDSATGNTIRNNIITESGASWNNVSLYVGSSPNTYQNNIIYSTLRVDPIYYGGYNTVTAFNALNGNLSNVISNNLSSNPLFSSTSDFYLTAPSPAIGAGTTALATLDYEGNTIPYQTTDIGIYESAYPD